MASAIAEALSFTRDAGSRHVIRTIESAVELAAYAASTTDPLKRRDVVGRARIEVAAARKQLPALNLIAPHNDLVCSVLELVSQLLDRQESDLREPMEAVRPAIADDAF